MILQKVGIDADDTYPPEPIRAGIGDKEKVINLEYLKKIEDDYRNNIKYFLKGLRTLLINHLLLPVDDLISIPDFILSFLRIR